MQFSSRNFIHTGNRRNYIPASLIITMARRSISMKLWMPKKIVYKYARKQLEHSIAYLPKISGGYCFSS